MFILRPRKIKGWIPKAAKFCRSFLIEAMAPNLWLWIFAVLPGVLCQIKKMEPLTLVETLLKIENVRQGLTYSYTPSETKKALLVGLVDLDSACINLWRFHWLVLSYHSLAVLSWKSVPNTNLWLGDWTRNPHQLHLFLNFNSLKGDLLQDLDGFS